MIQGFKEFILRGNVIDLAVAVVIGAAFSAIINVVVEGVINPLIALFFRADSLDTALVWHVPTFFGDGTVDFTFGAIIGAAINFLAVAVVVYFVFVLPMNHAKARAAARQGLDEEPELPTEQELLIQIRDALQQNGSTPPVQ